jgi:hypothetical protein
MASGINNLVDCIVENARFCIIHNDLSCDNIPYGGLNSPAGGKKTKGGQRYNSEL